MCLCMLVHGLVLAKHLSVSLRGPCSVSPAIPIFLYMIAFSDSIWLTSAATRNLNCIPDEEICTYSNNMGWRYVMYTCSGLVFLLSILRVTLVRLHETPKYLLGAGEEETLVRNMQEIAAKYNRPCTLTLEALQACGTIQSAHAKSKLSFAELGIHINGLFATRRLTISTLLIWLSWTIIGLAYPLYFLFLPAYLSSRGAEFGSPSPNETWRNYAIVNIAAIFSNMFAAQMSNIKLFGRKYTMVFGALVTSKLTVYDALKARGVSSFVVYHVL